MPQAGRDPQRSESNPRLHTPSPNPNPTAESAVPAQMSSPAGEQGPTPPPPHNLLSGCWAGGGTRAQSKYRSEPHERLCCRFCWLYLDSLTHPSNSNAFGRGGVLPAPPTQAIDVGQSMSQQHSARSSCRSMSLVIITHFIFLLINMQVVLHLIFASTTSRCRGCPLGGAATTAPVALKPPSKPIPASNPLNREAATAPRG